VVHLAACQYHTPLAPTTYRLPFHAVNVEGTRRVLEAAAAAGVEALVHVSTNMVYGLPQFLPLSEDHPLQPLGPYGRTKLEAERLVAAARGSFARTVVVRPGLLVGPGRVGVIGRIIEWVLRDRPIPLIGDGRNRYELMAAEDCARLALQATQGPAGYSVYNCGSAHVPTMREWITAIIREAGSRSFIVEMPGRLLKPALRLLEAARMSPLREDQYEIADLDYYQSTATARERLGWTPRWTGTDAALATFHWYRGSRARRTFDA
jgi:dTDP-glucose 4,6-dehydratase